MLPESFVINLKPSNKSIVQGCPGVPKTYPIITGTLEVRSGSGVPVQVDNIEVKFVTIDRLKTKPNRDTPLTLRKINYQTTFPINDRIISVDIPFIIGIKNDIGPTSETSKYGKTTHRLEVTATSTGPKSNIKGFEFPVVITTYDTLPLYRQFNEPISKVMDSKDNQLMLEYSLPSSAVGPNEELVINIKISSLPSIKKKLLEKVKVKRVTLEIVEMFDCRCDKSFIKENVIVTKTEEYNEGEYVGMRGFSGSFGITLTDPKFTSNKYLLFLKQQDPNLLYRSLPTSSSTKPNELKPIIIEHEEDPIPFTNHQPMTKKSNFFSTYYELRLRCKFSGVKDIEVQQPITIAPFDRNKSMSLLKWILKESELANEFMRNIESELGKISYDNTYDVLVYPQRKITKLRSKNDRESFT